MDLPHHRDYLLYKLPTVGEEVFITKYENICMICMKCMILIINMQQSYTDDLERQNERLRQQLEGLGINSYSGTGTLTARPSDIYRSEPTRDQSPWPNTYQQDDPSRGWSPWPDTHHQDD